MSRATPQQDRSKATVEKILLAANTEFAAHGSSNVTTTQIAERAGVSVGALYRFFPDKHAIGAALAGRYLEAAGERFSVILADVTRIDDVPNALRLVIRAAADLALQHPGYYRLTEEVRPDDESSIGHTVRTAMVDVFDRLLVDLGATPRPGTRRVAVTMAIETVRHTLAICPTSGPERSTLVAELEDMVVTYAERRLVDPDGSSGGLAST